MPVKTLLVDGAAGVMLIGDYGINEQAILNPENYLSNINFHSGLQYLQIAESFSKTSAIFPSVVREVFSWTITVPSGGCC